MTPRPALESDLDAMVALAAIKRAQYQAWQPVFHRIAADADAKQRLFLKDQLSNPQMLFLVLELNGALRAWVNLRLVPAPPVYEPGGKIGLVDDFCVADDSAWLSEGAQLLKAAKAWAKERGAVLLNVVCGPNDAPKRALLNKVGLSVASEWHVGEL